MNYLLRMYSYTRSVFHAPYFPPCLPPVSMLPQLPSYPTSCRALPSPPSAHLPPVKQCDLTPSSSLSSASKSLLGAQHLAPLMSHADRLRVPPRRASLQGHLCSHLAFLIRRVCPSLNQGSPRTEVASFILPSHHTTTLHPHSAQGKNSKNII